MSVVGVREGVSAEGGIIGISTGVTVVAVGGGSSGVSTEVTIVRVEEGVALGRESVGWVHPEHRMNAPARHTRSRKADLRSIAEWILVQGDKIYHSSYS